jgi:hypothetical protein
MYEISYGTKYEATKDLNRTAIAKLVREDIKAAVKAGTLPRAKYSVRKRDYAGGGSIDISFSHVEGDFVLFNEERVRFDIATKDREFTYMPIYSEQAKALTDALDAILNAYNFDGSESQVDYFHVRFYGHAKVEWQWEAEVRKATRARIEAEMAAPKVSAQEEWLKAIGV